MIRRREVCADKGYLSHNNCHTTEQVGAIPFIAVKENIVLTNLNPKKDAWDRMLLMWKKNKEVFLEHYHMRSNVESTFSMMKRKFLPYIRSKTYQAQTNEILCKVVCHNASVLCMAMFQLDVNLNFEEI